MKIIQLQAEETYALRRLVLRPGRPPEECCFEGDKEPGTFHLGVYMEQRLTGVASFMRDSHPDFDALDQVRLRGMAVLPDWQGKGIGAALLREGERFLKNTHHPILLWFNAREHAVPFYKKCGYTTHGEIFMIPGICPHLVMKKWI